MIFFNKTKETKKTEKILSELEGRLKYIGSELNRISSYIGASEMVRRLPKGKYSDSIEVFQTPQGDDPTAFGIRSKGSRSKEIEKTYLIYVKPSNKMKTTDRVSKVLANYSPWTLTTIPYVPDPSDAEIVTRVVNKNLADRVERMRERQRRTIDPQLRRAGARKLRDPRNLDKLSRIMKSTKTTEDLVVQGTALEFGWTKDGKPHWRPAISLARRTAPKLAQRLPNIRKSLYNSQYMGWAAPRWSETTVTAAEGAKYAPFAKLIRR